MTALRVLAVVLALSLMVGECWRSWGAGRPIMFMLDDQFVGGFLILTAWRVGAKSPRAFAAFAAAWGATTGMLYGSFFGKIFDAASAQPGNWDLDVLTWLVGFAFAVSLIGLCLSLALPPRTARAQAT